MESNRLYLTRYEYKNLDEKKLIFKKYLIPYQKEIKGIIDKFHNNDTHPGKEEIIDSIKNDNYYWIGMSYDLDKVLSECPVCASKYIEKAEIDREEIEKEDF